MQHLITRITRILRSPRGALGLFVALILGTAALALAPRATEVAAAAQREGPQAVQPPLCTRVLTASLSREHYPRRSSCRVGTGSCIWI